MAPLLSSARKLLEATHLKNCLGELPTLQGPLDAPPKPKDIIKFTTKTTFGDALKSLAAANILSAPVSDAITKEYVGMLDVIDILEGFLRIVYPELLSKGFTSAHKRLSITELEALGVEFASQTITSVLHGGDLWYKGDAESTLMEVVESGFRVGLPPRVHSPQHHLRVHHRIAVFDILPGEQTPDGPIPEWRITDIVSQMDILRLFAAKMDGDVGLKNEFEAVTVESLGLAQGADKVATVSASTPVLSVFAKMKHEHLSGIGVVGENINTSNTTGSSTSEFGNVGPLLANLSASDVRGLTTEKFGALALPIGAFLLLMHPTESHNDNGEHTSASPRASKRPYLSWEDALLDKMPDEIKEQRWADALSKNLPPLLTCSPSTTLREIVEMLVRHGKHRLYVCDKSGRAVGVVTPTDVLRAVLMSEK